MVKKLVTDAVEAIGDARGPLTVLIKTLGATESPTANRFPIGWQALEADYACLEVSNTGCGLDAMDIEQLFDPFVSSRSPAEAWACRYCLVLCGSITAW